MSSKDRKQSFAIKRQGTESMCVEVHNKLADKINQEKKVEEEK